MKIVVPDYYEKFHCIAEKCRHNCCIGWEIDIDEDTYSLYCGIGGEMGQRLKNGINHSDTPCFKLDKDERCFFLNENGLCDIITRLGEGALCDICHYHPRFRNFFSDRSEIGLGLSCEEACKIILENTKKVTLIPLEDDRTSSLTAKEKDFFIKRDYIIKILQNRNMPYTERVQKILKEYGIKALPHSPVYWFDVYSRLERLDNEWDGYLNYLKSANTYSYNGELDILYEQLSVYFVFRHLASAIDDGLFREHLIFCLHAVAIISTIFENTKGDKKDIFEICRMYSSEIEYSDENIEKIEASF